MNNRTDAWQSIPTQWKDIVSSIIEPHEKTRAWFEPDLDASLNFAPSLIVLTDQRVLAIANEDAAASNSGATPVAGKLVRTWSIHAIRELQYTIQSGLGKLHLDLPSGGHVQWRFTGGRADKARRLVRRFDALRHHRPDDPILEAGEVLCPSCGNVLEDEQSQCATCSPPEAPISNTSLFRLVKFARPRLGPILVGFALTLISTAAGLVPAYLTMPLMDDVLIPHQAGQPVDNGLVKWYLSGLAVAAVAAWLLSWARSWVLAWVSERISSDLRTHTYQHLQGLSLEYFGSKRTGDLMSRLSSDTDRICNFLSVNLLDFITDVLMMLMTAAVLVSINPLLAMVTLLPFPLIALLVHRIRGRLRRSYKSGSRAWGEMTSVLADTIPGIRVVKAFAQEHREVERFRKANANVLQANDRVNSLWAFVWPTVTLLTEGGVLIVWGFGVWQVTHQHVTVGVLTLFLAYIGRFYTKVESLTWIVATTQRTAASAQRIFEILDRVSTVPEPHRPIHPGRVRGEIELRHVGFQYGARPILKDVSLTIQPGEMIGLVGPSGAGKSTLINLVCRFYDVAEGAILVDGVDIRSFPVAEYRQNIGMVLQEPFLFFGTIAENIAYGRPDATRSQIVAAARAAKAHEFILRLPDGYDSVVGERGQSLSGGERQRISIARALLIDPRILILDEATSSVDTETEREIQQALENLIQGRTTIAIAHRLSTLRRADRLVVMEQGHIAEVGKHDELLKSTGTYSRLHHAQLEMAGGVAG